MTAPALRALRPAATTSAYAGDLLRARAAAPSRVSAISRTRHMAVRVCTVARRAPPRVAASARDPRVSIATATRRAPTAPPRAVRDPGVAVERADDAPASVQPAGESTETSASSRKTSPDSIAFSDSSRIAFERGVPFCRGGGGETSGDGVFYRAESAQARDLAVLLARLIDKPRVLDAMAGSGVRSARYLKQGKASHVHLNDASPQAADALLATLDALFSPPTSHDEILDDDSVASSADDVDDSYDEDDDEDDDDDSSADDSSFEESEDCDPSEAEDFASAVRCLPNPSQKPHPFKKTRRGTKTMSRQEKKALMETKMQKTKLFKLQKVTKKERKMRAEAEAAAAAAAAAAAEPEAFESECDDDDEACLIKEAMARAKEEKKRQRKKQRKKTSGSAVSSSVPKDSLSGDSTSSGISASEDAEDSRDAKDAPYDSLGTVAVTTKDARRLFASLFASNAERFDVVDVDSFGSDNFIDDALRVTKLGGYCYATGTDALALCGKNPPRLLSHYGGAFVVPNVSAVNETGLRVFVGDAVRRGAAQGLKVTPAFSLFHPHGPVFRAMLKVEKLVGAWDGESIGFLAQCDACGDARVAESDEIRDGACFCRRCAKRDAAEKTRMSVSGPLWTGPLHDAAAVAALAREAEEVDFCGGDDEGRFSGEDGGVPEEHELSSTKGQKASAKELLAAFAAEADPALPPFYRRTDELARAGRGLKHGIPPLDAWIAELQQRGFAACRSHLDARGLKSNAPLDDVVAAANAVAAAKNGGA